MSIIRALSGAPSLVIAAIHALTGAALGRLARTRQQSFLLGTASHIIADSLPHRDLDIPQEAGLLAAALTFISITRGPNSCELHGALGAIFPDLENLIARMHGLPDDKLILPTHKNKHGRKTSDYQGQLLITVLCVGILLLPKKRYAGQPW